MRARKVTTATSTSSTTITSGQSIDISNKGLYIHIFRDSYMGN